MELVVVDPLFLMKTVYTIVSSIVANTLLADFVAIRIASINCIFVVLEELVSEIGARLGPVDIHSE